MSIATNQSLLRGTHGKLGDLIIREVKGRTIISRLPNPNRPQTALQKRNRNQFKEAAAFAKAAMNDPEIKEYFRREAERRKLPNAYTAAVSFKLKDLKTQAHRKDQPETKGMAALAPEIQHQQTGEAIHTKEVNAFIQSYSHYLDPLNEALEKISLSWRNLEGLEIDDTQKEVMQTAVRLQIQQTLKSIHLTSKANAIEFKQPTPNFDRITALVKKAD